MEKMPEGSSPKREKSNHEIDQTKSIRQLPKLIITDEDKGEVLQECSEKEWDASDEPFSAELLNVKNAPNRITVFSGPRRSHHLNQEVHLKPIKSSSTSSEVSRSAQIAKMMENIFSKLIGDRDPTKIQTMASFTGITANSDVMSDMAAFKKTMREVSAAPEWRSSRLIERQRWNPYSMEGGSTCSIAGENFAIVASDTRMTQNDINILSRDAEKIHVLNDSIILSTSGFYGDVLQLKKVLQSRLHKYRFDYRADMSVDLCAELLARNLYYRRFFPYYTGAVLAGIDENGKGAVFSYDPIGCIERIAYSASGAAEPMIIPFLDCQIGHVTVADDYEKPPLTIERAISLMKDSFRGAAEREISTGDKIHVVIAEADKPIVQKFLPLRED